jgi:hypothetical protein
MHISLGTREKRLAADHQKAVGEQGAHGTDHCGYYDPRRRRWAVRRRKV